MSIPQIISYLTSIRSRYGVWPSKRVGIKTIYRPFEFRETSESVAAF